MAACAHSQLTPWGVGEQRSEKHTAAISRTSERRARSERCLWVGGCVCPCVCARLASQSQYIRSIAAMSQVLGKFYIVRRVISGPLESTRAARVISGPLESTQAARAESSGPLESTRLSAGSSPTRAVPSQRETVESDSGASSLSLDIVELGPFESTNFPRVNSGPTAPARATCTPKARLYLGQNGK